MSWLIDTNVISEVRKGPRCDRRVAAWYATADAADIHLSVLVLGEIRKGIALIARREPERADALAEWLAMVRRACAGRILPVDEDVAEQWGRLTALRPAPVTDALLAATALVHGLTLVTRNDRHVAGLGASVLNPFELQAAQPALGSGSGERTPS